MLCQGIWLRLCNVFMQLTLRKKYQELQERIEIRNDFRRNVTPIQLVVLGIGGTIGQ